MNAVYCVLLAVEIVLFGTVEHSLLKGCWWDL